MKWYTGKHLVWMVICALSFPLTEAQTQKPNIVFILCDDLGYGDLGCYGNELNPGH